MSLPPARLMQEMSEASQNDVAKLRLAMISCGVTLAAAALSLVVFKAPGGIFLRLRGCTPVLLYYGSLVAIAAFGIVQASFAYWLLLPRDMDGCRAIVGKMILWISILPLVLVAALGGFVLLK